MIDVKELRIENIVQHLNSICRIEEFFGSSVAHVASIYSMYEEWEPNIDELKPIPLTEEWLLRFGFEKDTKHDCIVIFQSDQFAIEWFCEEKEIQFVGHDSADNFENVVKYVHQLQNLYRSLTGKELEFVL